MNELLNRAGMDTISAGGVVAFAMECYQKGILTAADTDGLALEWGNSESAVMLVKKIIRREGFGDILADGVKIAAQKIGRASNLGAVHAGGQELPMHDGRYDPGFALHYSVEPAPGRHNAGSQMYYEMYRLWKKVRKLPRPAFLYFKGGKYRPNKKKAISAAACSKYMNLLNGSGCCMFGAFMGADRLPIFEWLNAATGWQHTPEKYLEIGHRIQTIKQLFNFKHGIQPEDFIACRRALGEPALTEGANRGRRVAIQKLINGYRKQMGWDTKSGIPVRKTLKQLGIEE
jgi:aldehyde:ferredoxin oxidoreductase